MAKASASVTSLTPSLTRIASTSSRNNLRAGALLLLGTQLLALAPTRAEGLSLTLLLKPSLLAEDFEARLARRQSYLPRENDGAFASGPVSLTFGRDFALSIPGDQYSKYMKALLNERVEEEEIPILPNWAVRYRYRYQDKEHEAEGVVQKVNSDKSPKTYKVRNSQTRLDVTVEHGDIIHAAVNGMQLERLRGSKSSVSPPHPLTHLAVEPQPVAFPQKVAAPLPQPRLISSKSAAATPATIGRVPGPANIAVSGYAAVVAAREAAKRNVMPPGGWNTSIPRGF